MLRPVVLVTCGLGGLLVAARWSQSRHAEPRASSRAEEPEAFLERHLEYELSGQFARSWDDLHPAHQRVVSRERYARARAERFDRSAAPTELQVFDVLEVKDETVEVAGLPPQDSKAVTAHIAIGLNGHVRSGIDTMHTLRADGHWVWVFPDPVYRAYQAGSSPSAG